MDDQRGATPGPTTTKHGGAYADDPVGFINDCCWTYDPRRAETGGQTHLRFRLFPVQERLVRWLLERLERREDGLVEKSRDMGLSWLICAFYVWAWLYREGFAGGIGSNKEDSVDRLGDPKSLFWKIRFIIEHLPASELPEGFDMRRHSSFMRIVNPAGGATITGEAGLNMGRGGRYTMYFGDEWAFVQRAEVCKRAISQATNCFIRGSTPNGMGNDFAETRFSGKIPVFTLHWRDHPLKDEAWYASQTSKYDEVTVAQEIDIDYSASIEGIFIPARWVQAAVGLELSPEGQRAAGLDVAEGGKARNVYVSRSGPVVLHLASWQGMNTTFTARHAAELATRDGIELLTYDADGVGAGVTGTYQSSELPLPFRYHGVRGGSSPSNTAFDDDPRHRAKVRFMNLRAELWWGLRLRFRKTFERVEGIVHHPDEECISLPRDLPELGELVAQLSMPLRVPSNTGKIRVESKEDMRKRGVKSPDHADALVYCFSHVRPSTGGVALVGLR